MNARAAGRATLASALVLFGLAAGVPARACMSYELNSVHFNANKPDFGLLPRRASVSVRGEYDSRPISEDDPGYYEHSELDQGRDEQRAENRDAEVSREFASAEAQAGSGRYSKAREIYESVARRYGWTGNLRDLAETMRETERISSRQAAQHDDARPLSRALAAYLKGIAAYEARNHTESQAQFAEVYRDTPPGSEADFLRAHALYQQASLAYEWFDFRRAVDLFQQLVREFPHTTKREAALIMIARCAILPATDEGRRLTDGRTALAALRKEYPSSRFRRAADGLQARMDWLEERYAPALRIYFAADDLDSVEEVCRSLSGAALDRAYADLLAAYMRRLTTARSYAAYERAIAGIDRLKKTLTSEETVLFHQRLLNDPDTAGAYLYYRLNHTENHAADTKRLAQLADRLVARFPAAKLPKLLHVEIAEICYHQGQFGRAIAWASRCLQQYPGYDGALYVRGAARHKLGRLQEAARDFDALLRDCPDSGLRPAAREEAALIAEATGDWSHALGHYFALNYRMDVAYLLDVRMTTAQMESYQRSPDVRQQCSLTGGWRDDETRKPRKFTRSDLLAYSLGIRYLRAEQWDLAEHWLKLVPRDLYKQFSHGRAEWESHPSPDPLTAVRELRALHLAARRARTVPARAQALFRYGSYYHSHGTLLLYNPILWSGQREMGFGMWWNGNALSKRDAALVRAYMYQHESYARSLKTCLSVYQRYPNTVVAPQALYRAACAARSLASFNEWWREEDRHENHWTESIRLMKRFVRQYPHHPLAKEARKYAGVFNQERRGSW